jgi:hypothetical protein
MYVPQGYASCRQAWCGRREVPMVGLTGVTDLNL